MLSFKNILVVRTDRIGDVVLTTPVFKALREHFPDTKISVLVAKSNVDLVKGNPYVDQIFYDDRRQEHKGIFGFWRLVAQIRKQKFDAVLNFHTKKRTNLLCFLAGIPERFGYRNNKFGTLLNRPIKDERHLGRKHETQYCLDVLKELGIENAEPVLFLPIEEESAQWVGQVLGEKNTIGQKVFVFNPGASDSSRCWPWERFAELMTCLEKKYSARMVLVGGKAERPLGEKIIGQAAFPVINLIGKTSVAQLVALLKKCDLLVSNDSGPVHVASAVATPVVSIITRNQPGINPERWKPLGSKSTYISVPPDSRPVFLKAGQADPKYLELIPVSEVLQAVDSIFKLC